MGLFDKTKQPNKGSADENTFTREELTFLLSKLRSADYKGAEFEKFYTVYVKIQNTLDNEK